ncbi:MAG: hypothetical protein KGQ95_05275 [Acidobacteria bacterium]|nr:hypothetical protein [Acidobacteriota bacterium]
MLAARLVAAATAAALAFIVAGCGASGGGSTTDPATTTKAATTAEPDRIVRLASGQRCYYGLTNYPADHPCAVAARQRCSFVDVTRNIGSYTYTGVELVCKP